MKHLKTRILVAVVVFTLFYLACAFVQLSFDISKWTEGCRFIVGVLGTSCAVVLAVMPNPNDYDS